MASLVRSKYPQNIYIDILFKLVSDKEVQISQNYWDKVLLGKQLRGNTNCEQEVKVVGIGVCKGLSLNIGEHKGLSPCQTLAALGRFMTCHTRHATHFTLCEVCGNILPHI